LERFRLLFGRRCGPRPSDAERGSHCQGRRRLHLLVRAGELHCRRASFLIGRFSVRSALSIVVASGDPNFLRKETPTIAEFFQKNGYTTYFSGKWHMGDKPEAYPIEHGFDGMKHFAAYYAGAYAYNDTSKWFHPNGNILGSPPGTWLFIR
jgi:arylsulfatase A-like enzyme